MFKVLDLEGKRIIVNSIDPTKHRHLSGSEFPKIEKIAEVKKPKVISKK